MALKEYFFINLYGAKAPFQSINPNTSSSWEYMKISASTINL